MQRLDDTLIDGIFQPWVDWTAAYLPADCFAQARVCTSLSAVAWILSQAGSVTATAQSGLVGLQVVQATVLLLGLAAIMVLHTLFQRADSGAGPDRANPLRITMYGHRMIILSGFVVGVVKLAMGSGSLAVLAVAFFAMAATFIGACSNPTPKRHARLGKRSGLATVGMR